MIERPQCVQEQELLAPHTTFKIGGTADFFASVTTEEELVAALNWADTQNVPFTILGGGSNVVFADRGFRGLVVQIAMHGKEVIEHEDHILLTVAAGENWDGFVAYTVDQGWWGMENLSLIPGTVGAASIQNIGAYGVEVASCIDSVRVYRAAEKSSEDFSAADCMFGYRDSLFKSAAGKDCVVTAVTFRLSKTPQPVTHYPDVAAQIPKDHEPSQQEIRDVIIAIRTKKFPDVSQIGTAGSFFKNPVVTNNEYEELKQTYPELSGHTVENGIKLSAAWLIDKVAGARGRRVGAVGTHDAQALVFVNYGNATASELDTFAQDVADEVEQKTKIMLEREVQFVL